MNYVEIGRRLLDGKKIPRKALIEYFARRHINPMIQFQWDALTKVNPAGDGCPMGVIHFPNGSSLHFRRTKI
jgi:hypothetical protein